MSTEKKETEIIYRLIDEVSQDIKKLQQSVDDANKSAENSQGFDSLTSKIVKANVATVALVKAFDLVKQGVNILGDVLNAGANLDMMNVSLDRVAANLGYTTKEVQGFRDSLEEANTLGSNQTAVLKSLMQTGLIPLIQTLQFANGKQGFEGLIGTIKDFGAAAQVSSDVALKDFSTAIQRLEPLLLDKYFTMRNLNFVYQDFAATLGKTAIELTENEKRQAFLNEIIRNGAIVAGVYTDTYDTAGKNLLSMTSATRALAEEIGVQLQPMYKLLTNSVLAFVQSQRTYLKENPQVVNNVLTITGVLGGLIAAFVAAPKIIMVLKNSLALLGLGFKALQGEITKTQLATGLLGVSMVALGALATAAFMKQVQAQEKAGDSAADLDTELQKLLNNMMTSTDQVGAGLDENIQKTVQLKQQIERENESFNKQLAQIVDARRASIEENQKLLDQEQKAFAQKEKDRQKKYQDTTKKISDENEQRLRDLEDTLGQELQVGSSNYDERLAAYLAAVDAERVAGEQRLAEAKAEYDEETQTLQSEYEERTSALQAKITADEKLLAKHAELIKTINRDVLRDEIAELQVNHQRRLEEINNQLTKEQAAFGGHMGALNAGWDEYAKKVKEATDKAKGSLLDSLNLQTFLEDMGLEVLRFYDSIVGGIWNALNDVIKYIVVGFQGLVNSIPLLGTTYDIDKTIREFDSFRANSGDVLRAFNVPQGNLDRLYGNAMGTKYWRGGATLVGERGAEIVDLPQGTRIYPADKSEDMMKNNGGNITIVNNYPEGLPAELVVSRQMFQIKTLTA